MVSEFLHRFHDCEAKVVLAHPALVPLVLDALQKTGHSVDDVRARCIVVDYEGLTGEKTLEGLVNVRRELVATVPDLLSAEDAKAHKDDLDALIGDVFSQVSRAWLGPPVEDGEEQDGDDETGENGGDGDASEGVDGTPAADEEEDDDEDGEEKKPPKKKQKRARGELTDEQLARQLSSELNGRQRSTRAGGGGTTKRGGRGGGRGGKRGAKSAARVEESDDEDGEGGKKKRKRKASSGAGAGGGGAKGGFGKEYALRYASRCVCLRLDHLPIINQRALQP
jgi:hypothetical protein